MALSCLKNIQNLINMPYLKDYIISFNSNVLNLAVNEVNVDEDEISIKVNIYPKVINELNTIIKSKKLTLILLNKKVFDKNKAVYDSSITYCNIKLKAVKVHFKTASVKKSTFEFIFSYNGIELFEETAKD